MALKHHRTTHFSSINVRTPADFIQECDSDLYTHFVTHITYGINCFFVFKRDTQYLEDQTSINGELEIMVTAIPSLEVSGGGEVDITDSQRDMLNTTNIRMFGDFSPDVALPATFAQAVNFYQNTLPSLVGGQSENWKGASALKVMLHRLAFNISEVSVISKYLQSTN